MKAKIHPQYYPNAQITCSSCGTVYVVGSTVEGMTVELCSACHPFYTGEQRIVDTACRVKRFENLQAEKKKIQASTPKVKKDSKKTNKIEGTQPLTLRDMLKAMQQENGKS